MSKDREEYGLIVVCGSASWEEWVKFAIITRLQMLFRSSSAVP